MRQSSIRGPLVKKSLITAASLLTVSCPPAFAAEADVSGPTSSSDAQAPVSLQEVVVTAQKREEHLKDVPISIVAIGADELKDRQITSMEDLPAAVPGLGLTSAGNSRYIEIRGVSDIVGSSSLIGIYVDDTDVTLGGRASVQTNPITFDLERVEVLRGPQGTLYGEGSAGGTVRFISKSPNLSHFGFDTQVATMFTEEGDPSQRINAMLNVPLLDGQLGLRIAGSFEHDGGWIDQPAAGRDNINAQDLANVRIKGLWQPTAQLSVSAMAIINRDTRGMDFSDAGAPYQFTQVFGLTVSPRVKNNYDLFGLTAAYEFSSGARITNTFSYVRAQVPQNNVPAYFPTGPELTPGTVFNYLVPLQDISNRLLTDELRVSSSGTAAWQWTGGGFFRQYTDVINAPVNYFDFPGAPGVLPDPYSSFNKTSSKSWSAFADTSYRFWDRFTVGAGVRAFHETQDFDDFGNSAHQTGTFHSVDPRAYAQFKLTPDINLYTSAAKGFRSGGFNNLGQPQYAPENVWTYEVGSKMALPQTRIDIDADVFLTNYANYQTVAPLPGAQLASTIQNVGYARIKGIEADASWRPIEHWRLDARGSWLDAKFTETAAASAYLPGDTIDLVPKYQFTLSAQRDYRVWEKSLVSRLDFSQVGPATYRDRTSGPWFFNESDTIRSLGFNTNLYWSKTLTFGVFARNLLNDHGFANPYGIIGNGVRSRPRTVGFEFNASFD